MEIRRWMARHGELQHFRPFLFDLPCYQLASLAHRCAAVSACARLTTTGTLSSTALVASATSIVTHASHSAAHGHACTTCSAIRVTLSSVHRC